MTMTDPVADMITRIRNAIVARHKEVPVPASKLKVEIARILKEEGYIKDFVHDKSSAQGKITIQLRYTQPNKGVISSIKKISKPGMRVYVGKEDIPSVLNGLGTAVLSTSRGVLTGKKARELGVGGEILFTVY
jgi:small subunit ribosomal protein S8